MRDDHGARPPFGVGGRDSGVHRLTGLAARLLGADGAAVCLRAAGHETVSTVGDAPSGGFLHLCEQVTRAGTPVVAVEDEIAFAGVPLVGATGLSGALSVYAKPGADRTSWLQADLETLADLAACVVAELELNTLSEELERARLRSELAIKAAEIGTFDWDIRSGELRWDGHLMRMFGYTPAEFGEHIDDFYARLHPDDRPALDRAIAAAVESCGEYSAEYRVVRPDGSTRWISARGRVLAASDGLASRMLGAAFDSTSLRLGRDQAARVLDTLSTGFFSVDRSWRLTYLNAEGERILGKSRADVLGVTLWDAFPGVAAVDAGRRYREAMETGQPSSFEAFLPNRSAWYEVRAQPAPDGLAVYFLDITERRQAQDRAAQAMVRSELLAQVSVELASTLEMEQAVGRLARIVVPRLADWSIVTLAEDGTFLDVGSWHHDPALRPVVEHYRELRLSALREESFITETLRTGKASVVPEGTTERIVSFLSDPRAVRLVERLAPESAVVLPLVARGRTVGMLSLYRGADRGPLSDEDLLAATEVAGRAGLVVDNARAYQRARSAQQAAEAAGRRLGLLAMVSEALTATLDVDEAMTRLARIVVPHLGDFCAVVSADDDEVRHIPQVAVSHRDPDVTEAVAAYVTTLASSTDPASPVATALASGQPVVLRGAGEGVVPAIGLPVTGLTVAPMTAGARPLGVLVLGTVGDRVHTEDEIGTATEVARRAGLALDNIRLYAAQRSLAEVLQRSMLTEPPASGELEIAVRYVPAGAQAQVGGDWYDAFRQPDGSMVVVIGDVVGHDIRAAAEMGQLRGLLRAIGYSMSGAPSDILTMLESAMGGLDIDTTATAVVARIDANPGDDGRRRVTWSSAGHPSPVLVRGGFAEVLSPPEETADLLLGFDAATDRHDLSVRLEPGSVLLLYTDGLVERRGSLIDEGVERLRRVMADLYELDLEDMCDALLDRLLPDQAEDDVALVAVRLGGPRPEGSTPAERAGHRVITLP